MRQDPTWTLEEHNFVLKKKKEKKKDYELQHVVFYHSSNFQNTFEDGLC